MSVNELLRTYRSTNTRLSMSVAFQTECAGLKLSHDTPITFLVPLRTLRCDDYGLQDTVGRVFFAAWATGPSTQRMVLKYKVKIADYRQQTTKFALFPYFVHINCLLKRFKILWFYCLADEIITKSLYFSMKFTSQLINYIHTGNTMISASNLSIQANCLSELRANKEDLPRLST